MLQIKYWLKAFRLKTLPLSLATVWMGAVCALIYDVFKMPVFIWATVTTLCLQILSNLANDYGDAVSGADNNRKGPARMVQSGLITAKQMMRMMIVFGILSLFSGLILLSIALPQFLSFKGAMFFGLGMLSIGAAINYTVGKNPYGYKGWGDFFVFLFFGLIGVFGSFYLHGQLWQPLVFLPAVGIGFFSVGVLNVNNLRDQVSDAVAGKRSLVVIFGRKFGLFFQFILILVGLSVLSIFTSIIADSYLFWLYLITVPFFIKHLTTIFRCTQVEDFNNELKRVSILTLIVVLLFAIALLINHLS